MKVLRSVAILLLVSQAANAIRIRDVDYEDSVKSEEETIRLEKLHQEIEDKLKTMNTRDEQLTKDYNVKLEQSKRNIEQGEMGRSLASSKVVDIKNSLSQIQANLDAEGKAISQIVDMDEKARKLNFAQQEAQLKQMRQRVGIVNKDISTVLQVESMLNDPNNGDDTGIILAEAQKDEDLQTITKSIQSSLSETETHVKRAKEGEEKRQAEIRLKEHGQADTLFTYNKRSKTEKEEMDAFLSGQTN
uniref:Uncharacterized protein n=1 Tax=Strombidium rassoulzadegani TaxID=1082188 RepID=A0A7S3FTS6_9SPIT|mmetsp:Transcript_17608/g.29730  ORF Transcript_17608/g.29730 Transcript_17608/m.29730 type:complete len:246 (+) Transcript_17608:7-744(+)